MMKVKQKEKDISMSKILLLAIIAIASTLLLTHNKSISAMKNGADLMSDPSKNHPTLTLAGGCFWCLESEFRAQDGILYTLVGYSGGELENPTYQDITTGRTGHAEAVQITYDPDKITEEELLHFFFQKAHDPTQLNRQGVDVGSQYRSAIFFEDEAQKSRIEAIIQKINTQNIWTKPIVTTLEPSTVFWVAEEYHQQYYEKYEQQNGKQHIRVLLKNK